MSLSIPDTGEHGVDVLWVLPGTLADWNECVLRWTDLMQYSDAWGRWLLEKKIRAGERSASIADFKNKALIELGLSGRQFNALECSVKGRRRSIAGRTDSVETWSHSFDDQSRSFMPTWSASSEICQLALHQRERTPAVARPAESCRVEIPGSSCFVDAAAQNALQSDLQQAVMSGATALRL